MSIEIVLVVGNGRHAGITLTDNPHGVQVTSMEYGDEAWKSNLQIGDVITHINGHSVMSHSAAIGLVQAATLCCIPLRMYVLKRKHRSKLPRQRLELRTPLISKNAI